MEGGACMRSKGEQALSILWFISLAGSACILYMSVFLHMSIAMGWLVAVPAAAVVLTAINLYLTRRREKAEKAARKREQAEDQA